MTLSDPNRPQSPFLILEPRPIFGMGEAGHFNFGVHTDNSKVRMTDHPDLCELKVTRPL